MTAAASDRARELITALQEGAYAAAGTRPPDYTGPRGAQAIDRLIAARGVVSRREQRRLRKELLRQAAEQAARAPSPYEDPLMYSIMVELATAIEQAAAAIQVPVAHPPVLGSLPHGQVNALTILVPGGTEHIVLFESQMFTFALLLSKAVARALPLQSDEDGWLGFSAERGAIEERIAGDESVSRRFTEVVLAYALTGRPNLAPPYVIEPKYQSLADTLRDAMEMFVLGHEYAHVLGGHLSAATPAAGLLPGSDAEALAYSWQQEHEADVHGARLALFAMMQARKVTGPLAYWGSDLFFSAMDVMDRAVSLLRHGDEERQTLGSHPPADRRRAVLRESMVRALGAEEGTRLIGLGEIVEQVVATLWTHARPAVLAARTRGDVPAATWR